jgi:hypothetical protein
VREVAGRVL